MTNPLNHLLEVFDPPLCCASGVCGPRVDPRLLRITSDLQWLKAHGVTVARYNLAQQPQVFSANAVVKSALTAEPETCLPLVLLDGRIIAKGTYPTRAELAAWLGLDAPTIAPPEGR